MDTERKIYGLLETVEQQQKSLEIAAAALNATHEALQALVDQVQVAANKGATVGATDALENAGVLIAGAVAPTVAKLHQVTAAATGLETKFRKAAAWVTWKYLLIVAVGCASVVLVAWTAVGWQRYEVAQLSAQKTALQNDIATLQGTVDSLAKKGGRIRLTTCGEQKRKCVKVDSAAGTFGGQGETYMIVEGY